MATATATAHTASQHGLLAAAVVFALLALFVVIPAIALVRAIPAETDR